MEVKLLHHTQDALTLLLRTKSTRLRHTSDPATWSDEQRAEHLAYMRDTIRSSWEFVDYTFEITGVTRAFTHQLVRTRAGSYAQESQRTVDVRDSEVLRPTFERMSDGWLWDDSVTAAKTCYEALVDNGVPVQDARGILPTNMTTNIIAKFSLRTLSEMAKVRLCTRTQGEYQDIFRLMRRRVIEVHPWVEEHRFIEVACVAEARCAFPRFGEKECKFHRPWMRVDPEVRAIHREGFWADEKQVAAPVANNGRTM